MDDLHAQARSAGPARGHAEGRGGDGCEDTVTAAVYCSEVHCQWSASIAAFNFNGQEYDSGFVEHEKSINHNKKGKPRCYVKSSTAQDVFWPIPGLISYAS